MNNPHSMQELKENIRREIANISIEKYFQNYKACSNVGGGHFETSTK
jgi:hypothetical protein